MCFCVGGQSSDIRITRGDIVDEEKVVGYVEVFERGVGAEVHRSEGVVLVVAFHVEEFEGDGFECVLLLV